METYNNNYKKLEYGQNIYDEKMQMIHNNIINGYEYRKYRQKVNNKVATLSNIFIQGGQMVMNKDKIEDLNKNKSKKEESKKNKNSNISAKSSEKRINNVFKNIREETIHFGDTVKEESEFLSNGKSQISKLPQLPDVNNLEEEKKENIEAKSEDWVSNKEEDINDNENKENKDEENKQEKEISKNSNDKKTNSKNSEGKNANSKNGLNENNEEKEIIEKL